MANRDLHNAKRAKQDEFYTRWGEIEREMNAYLEFNPDVFRGKVILCPCDDPEWSNFTEYFAVRFEELGIKKLISTSYSPKANMEGAFYSPPPGLFNDPKYNRSKDYENGKIFVLEGKDINGDGKISREDFEWEYLEGDGDFRSAEVTNLRDEADMVITNPPFSLFREFIAWLVGGGVQYSIIGNVNAITYKEVFPLIKDNKAWLGATSFNVGTYFRVPDNFEYSDAYKFERELDGEKVARVAGVCWFTNIEHGSRNEPLQLMTMRQNLRHNKALASKTTAYKNYDNYDAIEVPLVGAIPKGYNGVMGVPITFLNKYCPDQFEIVGISGDLAEPLMLGGKRKSGRFYVDGIRLYDRIAIKRIDSQVEG